MWNVARTHTRTKAMALNFTHTGKVIRVQRRKGWGLEGRFEWCYVRYRFVIRCGVEWYVVWCGMSVAWMDYRVWCGMVCCTMWNVCGLDGLQSVKRCRMVWWRRAYGVKWWREIAVWCGMSWCDFKCFCGMGKVMRSIQSSLLFLYYVVFSVMSVQYCLCVSRIQCTQCSVSVYRVGPVL